MIWLNLYLQPKGKNNLKTYIGSLKNGFQVFPLFKNNQKVYLL